MNSHQPVCDLMSKMDDGPSQVSEILKLREPISHRTLSTREQIILLEGSKLHGFVFPPWKSPPEAGEFQLKSEDPLFVYVQDQATLLIYTTILMRIHLIHIEMIQNYGSRTYNWRSLMAGVAQRRLYLRQASDRTLHKRDRPCCMAEELISCKTSPQTVLLLQACVLAQPEQNADIRR